MENAVIIKGEKGNATFSGLILNDNKKLEFRYCSLPIKGKIIFDEKKKGLLLERGNLLISLNKEDSKKLFEIENKIKREISSLYKDIISGKEKLMLFKVDTENYPYLITTKTILESEIYSPKYVKALEYAFSDKCLKEFNIGIYPGFKNYDDMQKKIGEKVLSLGLKTNSIYRGEKVISITLKEILWRYKNG